MTVQKMYVGQLLTMTFNGENIGVSVVKVNRKAIVCKIENAPNNSSWKNKIGKEYRVPFMYLSSNGAPLDLGHATAVVDMSADADIPAKWNHGAELHFLEVIGHCYGGLSPENLTCDGEASKAHINAQRKKYNKWLKACFSALGREVSEDVYWRWYMANRDKGQSISNIFNKA